MEYCPNCGNELEFGCCPWCGWNEIGCKLWCTCECTGEYCDKYNECLENHEVLY